jgi:hypothetical protein
MDFDIFEPDRKKDELSSAEVEKLDSMTVAEIEDYINYCEETYNRFNSMQLGLKLILNSVYGTFGNQYYVCSTPDIANAITIMGRETTKYVDKINEEYWYNYWHLDFELHKKLGISGTVEKIDPTWVHRESNTIHTGEVTQTDIDEGIYQRKVAVSPYIDTDSLFVSFEPGMKSCNYNELNTGKEQDFIETVCENRLHKLFAKKLNGFAKRFKVKNIQDFELENIMESIIFVTKKKYIKHVIWEDGRQYDRLTNITPKGVDLIKKGTPSFAREKVLNIINYLFDNPDTYNIKDLLKYVRSLRQEFEITPISEIAPTTNVNNYWSSKIKVDGQILDGPGIIEDKKDLKWGLRTYYTIKAAGLYNHLLYQHPELVNDYEIIRPGTKVRIYPTTHKLNNKFCYILGQYPAEFAPPVDYDELFQKTVADQANYYMEVLGLPLLNKRLRVIISLF